MAITLRVNKGTALTYEEMDVNLSSFFYSASLSNSNSTLNLHYTGSSLQGPSSISIPLDASGSSSGVAGANKNIQYNNSGNFGASSTFIFDSSFSAVGIGTSTVYAGERLRAEGGRISIVEDELRFISASVSSSFFIDAGSNDLTIRHNISNADADIKVLVSNTTEALRIKGNGNIGFGTDSTQYAKYVFKGDVAFGDEVSDSYRGLLSSFNSGDVRIENNITTQNLSGNSRGIFLEGPNGGHVVVGVQTEELDIADATETFSILSGYATGSNDATYHKNVASFRADGSVSLADNNFATGQKLTVDGHISGSGNISIEGTGSIDGPLTVGGALAADDVTVGGSLTVSGIGTGTPGIGYDILVAESNEVKSISAGVVPVGAIIMWSGNNSAIPGGWHLCDGTNGTPNLTDRFIIGAGNTYTTGSTGGSNTHNHGGTTGAHTLTSGEIPAHNHNYKDSYYIESFNPGVGSAGTIGGADYVGSTNYKGSGDSDNDNDYVYYRSGTTDNNSGGGGSHSHTISSANNIPVYYALSFIMYTGA